MTGFEIAFNICSLLVTVGFLVYLRHLVKTSGSDPIDDPERARKFRETAPRRFLP